MILLLVKDRYEPNDANSFFQSHLRRKTQNVISKQFPLQTLLQCKFEQAFEINKISFQSSNAC